ncbi:MAG: ABC transporter permease subunit [Actinobacteria bacterium]|nr:ABC transporter permease subunit [Actinomycetota bacterium]
MTKPFVAERRAARSNRLALAPALVVLAALFGGALLGALRASITTLDATGIGATNLDAWRALLADPVFLDSAWFTVRLAIAATVAAGAGALAGALVLRRRGTVVRALASLPLPVPHLLVAVVAVLWLAPGGLTDRVLGGLPFDLVRDQQGVGIVLVYVYKEVPFLVLLLLAAMGSSLAEREEAAAVLGASPLQRLRWVIWPTVRGPLVAGGIVVGAFVLGAFEVPLAVGPNYPPTLAEYALQATQNDVLAGESRAAAALLFTAVLAIALAVPAVRFAKDAQGA